MEKFYSIKVDDLTDAQCRELLKMIEGIVWDMPSFAGVGGGEHYDSGCSGRIYDPYTCCSGYTNEGHSKDCSIGQLKQIFGY